MKVTGIVREVTSKGEAIEALVWSEGISGWVWVGVDASELAADLLRSGRRVELGMEGLVEGWIRRNGYGEPEMVYRPVGLETIGTPERPVAAKGWKAWLLGWV